MERQHYSRRVRQSSQSGPNPPEDAKPRQKQGSWFVQQSDTVKAALITAVSTVLVGAFGVVTAVITGVLQFQSPSGAPGPATPTVTTTVTVTAAAPIATSTQGTTPTTAAAGSPRYLADMNPSGDAWAVGSWTMSGKEYTHSLGQKSLCTEESVTVDLRGTYRRLVAVVGVADNADDLDRDKSADFSVYVDADDDNDADSGEQIVARAGLYRHPATIDASFPPARRLILVLNAPGDCFSYQTFAVWGDPKVYP
jgi:hypothetical protein